MKHPLIWGSF